MGDVSEVSRRLPRAQRSEILSNILPDATVRLNLKYFGPSPKSNEAAGEPSRSGEWRAYNDVGQIVEARPGRASPAPA